MLKKNIQVDTILGYLLITAPETLKKWKVAITLVGQEYKSIERQYNYKTEIEMIYGKRSLLIDIGKSNEDFKDGKPKCFNYKIYEHIAKNY